MAMVHYHPLRSNNWKLPEPELEPAEEQEEPHPEVDIVWNVYSERGAAKSVALKISIRLPLNSSQCPHCEAAEQFPIRSRTHQMKEA
jgi:hypothetical protein